MNLEILTFNLTLYFNQNRIIHEWTLHDKIPMTERFVKGPHQFNINSNRNYRRVLPNVC